MAHAPGDVSTLRVDADTEVCCICLESLDVQGLGRQWLPCGHAMHELCVTELRRHGASGRCPMCRQSHTDLTPVQLLVDRGALHYFRHEHDQVFRCFSEALDVEPTNTAARQILAECYYDGLGVPQDLARCIELYEDAHGGGDKDAANIIGVIYNEQGEFAKAIEWLDEGRRGGDANASAYLADIYYDRGEPMKAKELWDEARRGGHVEAAFNLGVLHYDRGDLLQAMELYDEARRDGYAVAAHNLALLYDQRGEIAKAMKLYEEARLGGSTSEEIAVASLQLGVLHRKQGQREKAMELFEEARRRGSTTAAYNLGMLYRDHGDLKAAMGLFEEARIGGCGPAAEALRDLRKRFPKLMRATIAASDCASELDLGDPVGIHALSSDAGRRLNGLVGVVVQKPNKGSSRYGVEIPGQREPKAIQFKNLKKVADRTPAPMLRERTSTDRLKVGDAVWIHGCLGRVVLFNEATGRVGVFVDGLGVKEVWPTNLIRDVSVASEGSTRARNMPGTVEESSAQAALEESIADPTSLQDVGNVNAQIGSALLGNTAAIDAAQVVLLKFTRRPDSLQKMLLESDELAPYRDAIESRGLAVTLPSGAKILVRPDHYGPALEAIRLYGMRLYPNHVLVDPGMVSLVTGLARKLPGRESVHPKRKDVIPLGLAAHNLTHPSSEQCDVSRTFLHIQIPSSLRSESDAAAPRTVSTTDADPRKCATGRPARGVSVGAPPI